jgi:ABC-type glycerol-3-phosphate transport system substrate-binding protein
MGYASAMAWVLLAIIAVLTAMIFRTSERWISYGTEIQVSQHLAINAASEHKEAAALFINFFVNSIEAGGYLGTNRGIPSSPIVRQAISGDATPVEAMLYNYLNTATSRAIPQGPNLPNDQEFVDTLTQIGQSVSFGQIVAKRVHSRFMISFTV